jgi:hypothetical protein
MQKMRQEYSKKSAKTWNCGRLKIDPQTLLECPPTTLAARVQSPAEICLSPGEYLDDG